MQVLAPSKISRLSHFFYIKILQNMKLKTPNLFSHFNQDRGLTRLCEQIYD